jgi:purine nucleosidase
MHRVMLDVDLAMGVPGSDIDDGFALALAVADPSVSVELVTTVTGNTDAATATALTLDLLHRLGRPDISVHSGSTLPLVRPRPRVGRIPSGMPSRRPRPGPAALAMIDLVLAHPGAITAVAVGPLTNLALAIRLEPAFAESLAGLVIMGGLFTDPEAPAEFNAATDPEAAAIVLSSGILASWVGLDVTRQVRMPRRQAEELRASPRPFPAFAGRCAEQWIDHIDRDRPRSERSCALHDPLAMAAVTRPDLLGWEEVHLQIMLGDQRPGTMITSRPSAVRPANARVARSVDPLAFDQMFGHRLASL